MPGWGDWDPELAALSEPWEGFFDVKLECQPLFKTEPICQVLTRSVDFASIAMTSRGVFVLFSKRGQDWPFYGFVVKPASNGASFKGTTLDVALTVELNLDRDADSGALSGWIRDARIPGDVRVTASPVKLTVKRPLTRLYGRKILGEPLSVAEVSGNYIGQAYGDDAKLVIKDSALSLDPILTQASFHRLKENTVELFQEVTLDPIRGLIFMVQYDGGLPNRKWVLAFRREDIDYQPWLLGTGLNLRKPVAYDVGFEKNILVGG